MTNLKQIIAKTPLNIVFLSSWLEKQGIKPKSIFDHKKYGWLEAIGRGAFIKSGTKPDVLGGVNAIQYQTTYDLHIGGKFVLDNYHNVRQYLRNNQPLELFSGERKDIPKWFSNTFVGSYKLKKTSFLPTNIGLEEKEIAGIKLKISSPERALLEMLQNVPEQNSSQEAYQIFELMTVMKPELLNKLLQVCQSVKVKRLFMYFASKTSYPWVNKLDKIDLGSGVRIIDKTGKYDKMYNLIINDMEEN